MNNIMDDFSFPNIVNNYGVSPSPNNFPKPKKRPLSSSTPAIITDSEGKVRLVIGASSGTKIITSAVLVSFRSISVVFVPLYTQSASSSTRPYLASQA